MADRRPPGLTLDHIAIAARTLEAGRTHVRNALGVEVPYGGAHPVMGTHNLLTCLGPDLFLEVIAIDPEAAEPKRPRWFGLDTFDEDPRLAVWVLASTDIRSTLARLPSVVGPAVPITRGPLSWLLSVPVDGSLPRQGAFPSIIEWPNGSPASKMPDLGCRLRSLTIEHPEGDEIARTLRSLFADPRVTIAQSSNVAISAEIDTPRGVRTLR